MTIQRGGNKGKPAPRGKKGGVTVDFSDTQSQKVVDEGDYQVEVVEVKQEESQSGNDMLVFEFKVIEDEQFNGKKLYHNCSLQPQALFNLRGVLESLGVEVPQGAMELDPADLIGLTCGAHVFHEVYEGKTRAKISEFFPLEEEEAAAPAPAAKPQPVKKAAEKAPAPAGKKVVKKKAKTVEEGSNVSFTDEDGNKVLGVVQAINDGNADVEVGEEVWEISLDDLTLED